MIFTREQALGGVTGGSGWKKSNSSLLEIGEGIRDIDDDICCSRGRTSFSLPFVDPGGSSLELGL